MVLFKHDLIEQNPHFSKDIYGHVQKTVSQRFLLPSTDLGSLWRDRFMKARYTATPLADPQARIPSKCCGKPIPNAQRTSLANPHFGNETHTRTSADVGDGGGRVPRAGIRVHGGERPWTKVTERPWNARGTPVELSRLQGAGCWI